MLKRILVLLGETPSSVVARQYAFQLARDGSVALAGIGGIDLTYIEEGMPGRVGATAYRARLEESLKGQAADARARLRVAYEAECRSHGATFEWLSFDGDPVEVLELATETRDLIVTGHDTGFRGSVHEPLSAMLADLLLLTPRPVIVCGDDYSERSDVLVAYDGSVPAMRALQLFMLLGLGKERHVHVASVDPDSGLASRRGAAAAAYLRYHGCDADTMPIASKLSPAEILRIEARSRSVGTLVMGAYGHRGIRERVFGSTTTRLLENPPCALFVYH